MKKERHIEIEGKDELRNPWIPKKKDVIMSLIIIIASIFIFYPVLMDNSNSLETLKHRQIEGVIDDVIYSKKYGLTILQFQDGRDKVFKGVDLSINFNKSKGSIITYDEEDTIISVE